MDSTQRLNQALNPKVSVAPKKAKNGRLDRLEGGGVDEDLNQHQSEDPTLPAREGGQSRKLN